VLGDPRGRRLHTKSAKNTDRILVLCIVQGKASEGLLDDIWCPLMEWRRAGPHRRRPQRRGRRPPRQADRGSQGVARGHRCLTSRPGGPRRQRYGLDLGLRSRPISRKSVRGRSYLDALVLKARVKNLIRISRHRHRVFL
jgi:hypothetical protein